jgi:hypothetical protein
VWLRGRRKKYLLILVGIIPGLNWTEFNLDIINDAAHIFSNLTVMFNPIKHGVDYEPPAVTLRNSQSFPFSDVCVSYDFQNKQ